MKYNISLPGYDNTIKEFASVQETIGFGFEFMNEHLDRAEFNAEQYREDIEVYIDKMDADGNIAVENWAWLHGWREGTSGEWQYEHTVEDDAEPQPDKWEFIRITESGERYVGRTENAFYTDEEAKHQCDYLLGNVFDSATAVEAWRNGEYVCESNWEEK